MSVVACVVCMQPFREPLKAPVHLECPHSNHFCVSCVCKLRTPQCPLCRAPIDTLLLDCYATKAKEALLAATIDSIGTCITRLQDLECWDAEKGEPRPRADFASDVVKTDDSSHATPPTWTLVGEIGPPSQFHALANAYAEAVRRLIA